MGQSWPSRLMMGGSTAVPIAVFMVLLEMFNLYLSNAALRAVLMLAALLVVVDNFETT
jgi:hypothetical protein